jgi:predicted SPOUT superfamily RNA methylase MTH1
MPTKKNTGEKVQQKIHKVMDEFKHGELRSGSGRKVEDRKQAIAIGLSEARATGAKIPKKRTR